MKRVLLSAVAAVSVLAIAPALAQTAPAAPQVTIHRQIAMQPMTRAAMIQKVQQHFARLDADRDGFITRAELDAAPKPKRFRLERRGGDGAAKLPDRGAMFDRLDSNRDGYISRQEFTSAQPVVNERRVFVIRDGTAAGEQGHRGMMGMHMRHGGMGVFGGHMFEMADANKDGRVSLQEATAAAAAHFDRADANHDGTLTREEMRAAHQAMRGKMGR